MKAIIVSDVHLTGDFDNEKYLFLRKIFSGADRIVLNGDFWSCYSLTFSEFLDSKWNKLFPLLKSRKTVFIFGNHDRKKWMDERANVFSDRQVHRYLLQMGGKKYLCEHGHLLFRHKSISNDIFMYLHRKLKVGRLSGIIQNYSVRTKLGRKIAGKLNKHMMKRFSGVQKQDFDFLVTGHSHFPELLSENRFINVGYIDGGRGSYLEIDDSRVIIKEEKY